MKGERDMRFLWVMVVLLVPASCATQTILKSKPQVFFEDFSEPLDTNRWVISTWTAPRNGPTNKASFKEENVIVRDGMLRIKLSQTQNPDGTFTSVGGEVKTIAEFGYGTYRFAMKASSTSDDPSQLGDAISGTVTGAGAFRGKSETEIDIEVEGLAARASLTQTTTWTHEDAPSETYRVPAAGRGNYPHYQFHAFKFVWKPGKVEFYRDNQLIATHVKVVPEKPASFIFNHWGTNDPTWGGIATPGIDRYMFIKNFSFTPLAD